MTVNQKNRRVGGSSSLKKERNTTVQSSDAKSQKALKRIMEKVGEESMQTIKETFHSLSVNGDNEKKLQADGIILNLMDMGISNNDIKFFLHCGGPRVNRLRLAKESGFQAVKEKNAPKHALSSDDIERVKSFIMLLPTEEGYPCCHRRMKNYLMDQGLTWKQLWRRYETIMEEDNHRVVSYERWLQYVHYEFPGLRLSRTKEDLCDACTRIEIELLRDNLTEEDRNNLILEKEMHMDAAKIQRQAMNYFIEEFVKNHNEFQILPEEIIPEYLPEIDETIDADQQEKLNLIDDSVNMNKMTSDQIPTVIIQAEDFGGNLNLPFYGFTRPSCDYFSSNLLIHNFVIANINENKNYVWFYDERGQDKGADAMCSFRMYYELIIWEKYRHSEKKPSVSLRILDNCIGQNKSNIVLKFFAMLSLLYYKKVTLIYLIPGHSHMIADRVVAWMKRSIKKNNIFHPSEFVEKANSIKSIEAKFFDHSDPKRPFYVGWENILNKYFKNLPSGFTKNFFFEFEEGTLRIKNLYNSEEENTIIVDLLEHRSNMDLIKKALIIDIFGKESIEELELSDIFNLNMERHVGNKLKKKKILSLSKKYPSIPHQYLPYYPVIFDEDNQIEKSDDDEKNDDENNLGNLRTDLTVDSAKLFPTKKIPSKLKVTNLRKVGRPKQSITSTPPTKTILSFFPKIEKKN